MMAERLPHKTLDGRRCAAVFAVVALCACSLAASRSALAANAQSYIDSARQYLAKGDVKAAEIQLRNAESANPKDPSVHVQLAEVYLRLGDNPSAEVEARTAQTDGASPNDFLPPLLDSLLRQGKYGRLLDQVEPGARPAPVESKVRLARGLANIAIHNSTAGLADLRDAVRLDPTALPPKIALARVLVSSGDLAGADKLIDEALSKDKRLVPAILVKAEILQARRNFPGAAKQFDEALTIDPQNIQAHLGRANLYLIQGNTQAADKELDPLLKANPNNVPANYLRGLELAQQRKFDDAEQVLTKIESAFPNLVEGYYLLGSVELSLGHLEQADADLAKYNARVPNNPKALRLLASIALRRGDPSRAIEYLTQLKTPDAATWALLGNAYTAAKKPELALSAFQKAADLAPNNPQVKTQLALTQLSVGQRNQGLAQLEQVYDTKEGGAVAGPVLVLTDLRLGQVDKAAAVAKSLVAKDGDNPVYLNLLGLVQSVQHDYPAAEATLRKVVDKHPDFGPATHNLAQVYIAAGERDKARQAYLDLLKHKPQDTAALLALAGFSAADHDWAAAVKYLDNARASAPNNPKPGIALINLYLAQHDAKSARAIAAEFSAQFPKNVDVLDAQARAQLAGGDNSGAAATYRLAVELAPTSQALVERYVAVLLAGKNPKEARSVLETALGSAPNNIAYKGALIRLDGQIDGIDAAVARAKTFTEKDPKNPAYDLIVAGLYEKAGRASDAIALLNKAVSTDFADSDPMIIALSGVYLRNHQPDKAVAILQARLAKKPGATAVQMALGDFYLQQRQLDKAADEYQKIIKANPSSSAALNNLAWIRQQQGNMAEARKLSEQAIAIAPQNPAIADTLGWIMTAQGDPKDGLKYLKLASASSPSPDIHYHLAVALQQTGQIADAKAALEPLVGPNVSFAEKPQAEKLLHQLQAGQAKK